jgi:ubiquinone/menaquinone biosynthesis C-methylase UbiE
MLMGDAKLKHTSGGSAAHEVHHSRIGDRIRDGETVAEFCARIESEGLPMADALDAIGLEIAAGRLDVEWATRSEELKIAVENGPDAKSLCKKSPHLWNVLAYEREWKTYPEYNDFLDKKSPVHNKKKFEWEIYESLLGGELSGLAPGSRVLDVGAGVGRAAVELAKRGAEVTLVDASPRALKAAWRHLAEADARDFDLVWADAERLDFIETDSMDAALAIEVFCYLGDPEKALREAVRCVRPGGWVAFSVEARRGAMAADPYLRPPANRLRARVNKLLIEDEIYVKYFSRRELKAMAADAGLESFRIEGCHFVADGIFNWAAGERDYARSGSRKRIHGFERFLRNSPLAQFARAWFAVGRVR